MWQILCRRGREEVTERSKFWWERHGANTMCRSGSRKLNEGIRDVRIRIGKYATYTSGAVYPTTSRVESVPAR